MRIRLTEWASRQGIAYITAFRWSQRGKVPGLHRAVSGRLFVDVEEEPAGTTVALYGRVSSAGQSADLDRQMGRLRDFASARGLVVAREVRDIGSGLNGHRKRLIRLISDPAVGVIVIEHRDRLARFGVEYIEAALSAQGRTILVMNEEEEKLDLVQDFVDVVTSMCARIYGRRAASNRAKAALAAAEATPHVPTARQYTKRSDGPGRRAVTPRNGHGRSTIHRPSYNAFREEEPAMSVNCSGCGREGVASTIAPRDVGKMSGINVPPGWDYTSGPDTVLGGYLKTRWWCPDCRAPASTWNDAVDAWHQRRRDAEAAWQAANPPPKPPWENR